MNGDEDLDRIRQALGTAGEILRGFHPERVRVSYKGRGSPVTEADLAVDAALRQALPRGDEGWLSEESPDDVARLGRRRVWIVDPLDGTREFLSAIPEWCVSIGLAEDGVAVAGGIYNPVRDELFLGALGRGVTLNGRPVAASARDRLDGAVVLMGRWGTARRRVTAGASPALRLRAVGPVAYTLALVAAGRADAAWSRSGKAEWDIAAGAALVQAAGGHVTDWEGRPLRFNRWPPRAQGMVASGPGLADAIRRLLAAGGKDGPAVSDVHQPP